MNWNSKTRKVCPKCHGKGMRKKDFPDLNGGKTMMRITRIARREQVWESGLLFGRGQPPYVVKRQMKWYCINCGHERF